MSSREHVVKWSPRLTFLGTVITLCGNDDEGDSSSHDTSFACLSKLVTVAHKQSNTCCSTCGCISHLSPVVILLAGSELNTHQETIQLHWQLVCSSRFSHDQSKKVPRGAQGLVVETSTQRRKEILDKTQCRCDQRGQGDKIPICRSCCSAAGDGHCPPSAESASPSMVEGTTSQDSHESWPKTTRLSFQCFAPLGRTSGSALRCRHRITARHSGRLDANSPKQR